MSTHDQALISQLSTKCKALSTELEDLRKAKEDLLATNLKLCEQFVAEEETTRGFIYIKGILTTDVIELNAQNAQLHAMNEELRTVNEVLERGLEILGAELVTLRAQLAAANTNS